MIAAISPRSILRGVIILWKRCPGARPRRGDFADLATSISSRRAMQCAAMHYVCSILTSSYQFIGFLAPRGRLCAETRASRTSIRRGRVRRCRGRCPAKSPRVVRGRPRIRNGCRRDAHGYRGAFEIRATV